MMLAPSPTNDTLSARAAGYIFFPVFRYQLQKP
jgi:hypothetical protein